MAHAEIEEHRMRSASARAWLQERVRRGEAGLTNLPHAQ